MQPQKTTHVPHKTIKPLFDAINQAPKTTNCTSFNLIHVLVEHDEVGVAQLGLGF